tara:strand:+ start:2535 stop:3299 length:765 start_codon:yes stop_codon:yes gene_type:complete
MKLPLKNIEVKELELTTHPLLSTNMIQSIEDLRVFMEHHVFPVWDFMSLAKALQHRVCPSGDLWLPEEHTRDESARLINEIIWGEESDKDLGGGSISHFDLYLQAMMEIGANTTPVQRFLDTVKSRGIEFALDNSPSVPECCIDFMKETFSFIATNKKHVIASAFTFGREAVIPGMFTGILQQLNINSYEAKKFHYYLERHIELDGDEHGPMATKLVENLCGNDPLAYVEAEQTAIAAMNARIEFWNKVEKKLF